MTKISKVEMQILENQHMILLGLYYLTNNPTVAKMLSDQGANSAKFSDSYEVADDQD